MPGPHGQTPRKNRILLRLTDEEDEHVRDRAETYGTSINEAIASLIRQDRMNQFIRESRTPADPAPAPDAAKRQPPRRTGAWPADEHVPGHTSITDPDQ